MFTDPRKNVAEFGFTPGQKVADFGAGSGHYSIALSETLGETGRVYAVDMREEVLVRLMNEARKENRDTIRVITGNLENERGSQLGDAVVDGVVLSNLLFQLTEKDRVIKEAYRVLVMGGRVGVVEWSDQAFLSGIKTEGGYSLVTEPEAKELFSKHGFTLERTFNAGEHHYGLIFKKVAVNPDAVPTEATVLL